ncbi:hypothetical protein SO802_020381 [Lithocarpus litseifolius]|uniref:FKBP12-interacting protein of 37 kDa-like n=1 Tax=Lithocarpus litseifolius TaxID=425828 RepID=A0AAW2CFA3_9ROSI
MNLMNDICIFLNVLAALSQNIQPLPFVELVEALVASRTVNFAMEISILQLEFEARNSKFSAENKIPGFSNSMASHTHLDDDDEFGGDFPGTHNARRSGNKRNFGDLEDDEDDMFGLKKGKLKVEETAPGVATGMILSLRESLQTCKDNLATCQEELEAAKSEIQMWHSSFQNESFIPTGTSPEPKLVIDYLQMLKSSEESLREQLEKAKKKEAAFIVTFAKREQEISELKRDRLTKIAEDNWSKAAGGGGGGKGSGGEKRFDPELVKEIYKTELLVKGGRKPDGVADRDKREQLLVGMERPAWEEKRKKLMEGKMVWSGIKRVVRRAKAGIERTIH